MAPTNRLERLEREAEDLAKEYHNASIAARSAMASQNRLTQILSKHANTVVASIASMVQDIAHAKINTALKQQEITMTRAKLTAARKQHDLDTRTLQMRAQEMNAYRTLAAKGSSRSLMEEVEYHRLRATRGTLRDNLNKASEAERKSANSVNALEQSTQLKTSELKNIKLTAFATTVNSANTEMQKLVGAINKTQEQFGIAAGQAANLKVENIVSSFNSYVESAKSLFSGKPEFGVSAEMIEGAQAAYQNEFGGILTTDAAKDLAMQARTMGVTTEQLTKARRVFTAQSLGNVAEAKKSQDKFIAEFAKKGLTSKDAMQAISQYSELLARNGTRFAQSFTRAAADAKKIGIDLNKVSQFGDNLINDFEGFLEGSANLGAMGFNLDSNRLAQISETGSDADLYNELKSQLANTGKDITKLRRSERLELESMFGMTISDMQKMAGETPEGDTKSPEELQAEGNGSLAKMAVGMDLLTKLLSAISTGALAFIAANSAITAFSTSIMASGVAALLVPIAAGIATIAAVALLWKLGSALEQKGQEEIKKGNYTTGVIDKAGAGMFNPISLLGVGLTGLGAAASLTGIGAALGVPMMSAGMTLATGGALGGAVLGANEGINAVNKVKKGDDVISQPGYGKRSLVTPSGVIALNNKDNIIAYADDLAGTKKLPYGSIAKKLGMGSDTAELISTGLQKFAGKRAAPRLLDLLQGKQFFNLAKGARGIPGVGALASGALSGFEERQAGAGLGKSILKGLFVGGGSLGGAMLGGMATGGNPFAAGASGIAGGKFSEMAFEAMFGTAKKYHKGGIVGGKTDELPAVLQRGEAVFSKLQIGGLNKIIGGMNTLSSFGDKFTVGTEGVVNKLGGMFGGKAGKAISKAQELKAGGTGGLLSMAQTKFGGMFGGKAGGAIAKAQELKAGGTSGLLSMAQNKFGDIFGGKAGGAMSSVSNLFTGGGSTSSNLMSMATKIPGLGGLLGKATGLLGGGGLKGVAGSLLGKVGLGSLGGSLLGGPMGLAGSLAAPLLKKIPFVGGALASIAGGPGKLVGSALGKIGGLFGKKKAPAVSAMGAMMPDMGNMMSMLPFLSGAQSTTTQGTTQPQAPISVDTTGIEKQLNNFINALQGIQIHMDGAKVGKALVNSNDAASSLGVFREQSR
jgi:hypothetical protein